MFRSRRQGVRNRPREESMNFEKYTDRSRGFVQSAQSLALARGTSAIRARTPAQGPARRPEGLAAGLIDRSGGNSRAGLVRRRGGARQAPESIRRRRRAGLSRSGAGAGVRYRRESGREGRRQLRHRRAPFARAGAGEGQRSGQDPRQCRRDAAKSQRRHRGAAQGPHRRFARRPKTPTTR